MNGEDEYLTVAELAARLKIGVKTARNHMYDGTWQKGIHWFSPRGIGPRFSWNAMRAWLRDENVTAPTSRLGVDIPLAQVGGRRPRRVDSATVT